MKKIIYLCLLLPLPVLSKTPSSLNFGGFLDTYYAIDTNNPSDRERAGFQTAPARHNEFNINMAYVEAVLNEQERRGRLALQYGTSVDRNYAGENNKSIQTIQEAYVGIKLNEKLWLEAGIFFSHIGIESYISKYNINYTRSLNADNVPYYASGVRFEYQLNGDDTFHLHLLNGWQNIQETNSGKALGMKYQRSLDEDTTFVYNNFLGDEKVTTPKSRFRTYHNFIYDRNISPAWKLQSSFDIGTQSQPENDGVDTWYATSFILGQTLDEVSKMGYRIEYYLDRHQSNIVTGTPGGFQVASASVNYDRTLASETLWRTEVRGLYSKDKVFPQGTKHQNRWDGFLVTSLAVTF